MSSALPAYLPQDRLRALAHGGTLPEYTHGAALFADTSGFTALTERLTHELGPRRGIEELTQQINAVYDALIGEIERYDGSVISFAGDAITCWFEHDTGVRTAAAALAAQAAMQNFPTLGLKLAVTTGPVRRFVVGDPQVQLLDTLAGATIARLASAEHLAQRGEVLLDSATADALADQATLAEWRTTETGERFAVLTHCSAPPPAPTSATPITLPLESVRPWVHPAVYARELSGHGAFLTELRPAVALFVRFTGIAYDEDEHAGEKLSTFIAHTQAILMRHAGVLIQLTIGDKGSYLYAAFGVPIAHENDARRAVQAALDLQETLHTFTFLQPVQIGLSRGIMRTGAYGGATRRTYGALGDDVNLAARLMMAAAPGATLVSGHLRAKLGEGFTFGAQQLLRLKGKSSEVPAFAVLAGTQRPGPHLQAPAYHLPMVGRQAELHVIAEKLALTRHGQAQIIGIVAEAGMGKSRLVAEVLHLARHHGFTAYGGTCQSDGVNTPYLAWQTIWEALFELDHALPASQQIHTLTHAIATHAPERLEALPLLGPLLNLAIPDNDFTRLLEPKDRKGALHALLEDCLKTAAQVEPAGGAPLLLIIEDLHWIDALSYDLLDELARATTACAICFVLAYRPPDLPRLQKPRLEALPNFTKLALAELTPAEATQVIQAKLAQLYPTQVETMPPTLSTQLLARAQGNPFFLEEILNFLHARGFDPHDPTTLEKIELPDSMHTLVLSRIDQLSEPQKTLLRVASIIGRLFRADWLLGYYPTLGDAPQVQADLHELHLLDITLLEDLVTPDSTDMPAPELAYLFKHRVTHEVTYESLPFAMRAQLHEQLAHFLEARLPTHRRVDLLAYHYGQSTNTAKQREYFAKAGASAQSAYANEAALAYYSQLLPLLPLPQEQLEIHVQRGAVYELTGQWPEAESDYSAALALAQQIPNPAGVARLQKELGVLAYLRADYDTALAWLARAQTAWTARDDQAGVCQALIEIGFVFWRQGEYAKARPQLEAGRALAQQLGDPKQEALALHHLGTVAWNQGDLAEARQLFETCLALRRTLGDKRGIALALYGLGSVANNQGDYASGQALHEASLALKREIGDKWGIAASLNSLGVSAVYQGNYQQARVLYQTALALQREMGDKRGVGMALNNLGDLSFLEGDYTAAQALHAEALALRQEIGAKLGVILSLYNLGLVASAQHDYARARTLHATSLQQAHAMANKADAASNLAELAAVALSIPRSIGDAQADPHRATRLAAAAQTLTTSIQIAMEPAAQVRFAHTCAAARAALGEAAFTAAWNAGTQLTLDDAVEYATKSEP